MKKARMLGNYIEYLADEKMLSIADLSRILECTEHQVYALIKGKAYASFPQISRLAAALNTTVTDLLAGDEAVYNKTVVHCMNEFQDPANREEILDIIDDYIDVIDAIALSK